MNRLLLALSATTALLSGCGNDSTSQEYKAALATATAIIQPAERPSPEGLGRAAVASIPGPVMVAVLRDGQAVAALVPFGANAGYVTWSTVEKQTLTMRQGVLTATRGLGDDLMSSEVSGTSRAIAAGRGDGFARVSRHLDGDDQTIETVFSCSLTTAGRETITLSSGESLATTRMVERCTAGNEIVENIYWKDIGGTVRRSRQWISASLGYILIDVLRT